MAQNEFAEISEIGTLLTPDVEERLTKIMEPHVNDSPEIALLKKWFAWWRVSSDAPAKMPDALHIETLTFLIEKFHEKQ